MVLNVTKQTTCLKRQIFKNYRPKDQVCTYLRSNKLEDQLCSILQQEAWLKNFGHVLSTIKFDVLIINIDSKSKDIIAKLRLKGFLPYKRDLIQFHLPFRTLWQNYLTSLGLRENIYITIWQNYLTSLGLWENISITIWQNYLTSLGLREDIYITICGTWSMLDFLKSLKCLSLNIIIMSSISNYPH
jgi:hypothetical protein